MKRIHNDRWGSENLTVILLLVGSVVVIGGLLVGLMNPLFVAGEQARESPDASYLFGDITVGDYWVPTDGYDVTWSDATTNPYRLPTSMLDFAWDTSYAYLDVIRNNSEYNPGINEWDEKYYDFIRCLEGGQNWAISFSYIENNTEYVGSDVYCVVYPDEGFYNSSTAVIITFEDDSTEAMVNSQLWTNNTFNLKVAYVLSTSFDVQELSWYNTAWMLMTWQFSETATIFDYIFAAIFDMLILVAVIVVFSRIVHGG